MRFGGDVTCMRVSQALLMQSARCISNRHMTGVPKDSADLPASAARLFVFSFLVCSCCCVCLCLLIACLLRKLIDQIVMIPHTASVETAHPSVKAQWDDDLHTN